MTAVFSYATGQAYTKPLGRTQVTGLPWTTEPQDLFIVGNINSSRLPSYHRLDLSLSREGTFFQLGRSEEHTSELQSRGHLVCRLLLEKKNKRGTTILYGYSQSSRK